MALLHTCTHTPPPTQIHAYVHTDCSHVAAQPPVLTFWRLKQPTGPLTLLYCPVFMTQPWLVPVLEAGVGLRNISAGLFTFSASLPYSDSVLAFRLQPHP